MPVEIRELIIRANVGTPNQSGAAASSVTENEAASKEEILKECITQVMEILKDKNER